jgi:hypothetical protein
MAEKFNQSEYQKTVWAGRSRKERSAIGCRIAAARREHGTNTRTPAQKVENSKRQIEFNKTPAGRRGRASCAEKQRGKKKNFSREGRANLSKSKLGAKNPMKRLDVRKKWSIATKKRWAAIPKLERLKTPESRERFQRQELKKKKPGAYAQWLSARISAGQKKAWRDGSIRRRRLAALQASWDANHETRVAKTFTPSYRRRHSLIMKECAVPHNPTGPRKVWYTGPKGRIAMRSAPEVLYAKCLDAQGLDWLYEPVTFVMGKRTWTPDFYVRNTGKFVEVKGWFLPSIKRKINRVRTHLLGSKLQVIFDKDVRRIAKSLL